MEELQDAIEDAQYMNAVHDENPKPTANWKTLSPEKLQEYINAAEATNKDLLSLDAICVRPVGFYLFTRYAKEQGYGALGEFLMDTAKYRSCANSKRNKVAFKIRADYLVEGSTGRTAPITSNFLCRKLDRHYNPNVDLGGRWAELIQPQVRSADFQSAQDDMGGMDDRSDSDSGSQRRSTHNRVYPVKDISANGISFTTSHDGSQPQPAGGLYTNDTRPDSPTAPGSAQGLSVPPPLGPNALGAAPLAIDETLQRVSEVMLQTLRAREVSGRSPDSVESDDPDSKNGDMFGNVVSQREMSHAPSSGAPSAVKSEKQSKSYSEYSSGDAAAGGGMVQSNSAPVSNSQRELLVAQGIFTGPAEGRIDTPPPQPPKPLPRSLFDTLDYMVYKFLQHTLWEGFKESSCWERYWQFHALAERPVDEDDFSLFRVVGRGGFGLVNMCKRTASGKLFAIKAMNKKRVKLKQAERLIVTERDIMATIDSPFVVCLIYAFATSSEVYLVVDLMMGGDLGYHLNRRVRFNSDEVKFYAARTVMGIAALHEKDILYRDLKPDNILMDSDGFTKLSDLGLATRVGRNGTSGTCGTRGYWAPEMLRRDPTTNSRTRYNKTVDWFSFGCLIYEFIYGCSPFRTNATRQWAAARGMPRATREDRDIIIDTAILEWDPEFDPQFFTPLDIDFISSLLKKVPHERLGAGGAAEVMAHPWFEGIDWDQITFLRPPWKPQRNINMANQQEIGSFSDEKASNKLVLTPQDHAHYDNWSFSNRKAFEDEVVEFLRNEEAGKHSIAVRNSLCCTIS